MSPLGTQVRDGGSTCPYTCTYACLHAAIEPEEIREDVREAAEEVQPDFVSLLNSSDVSCGRESRQAVVARFPASPTGSGKYFLIPDGTPLYLTALLHT